MWPLDALSRVQDEIVACRACPRLVAWRERVALDKRAAFRGWDYWGRPVPGFGDPDAHLLIVGLAPAAHGANRTGRVFTGDRSGDFLFASLHRCGYANQPTSEHREDGLALRGAWVTAAVRCAPPANKPTPVERENCRPYLEREVTLLRNLRVVVALGRFGYDVACGVLGVRGRLPFAHGVEVALPDARLLVGAYHVSQQNTFTGVLTAAMLDEIFIRARGFALAG